MESATSARMLASAQAKRTHSVDRLEVSCMRRGLCSSRDTDMTELRAEAACTPAHPPPTTTARPIMQRCNVLVFDLRFFLFFYFFWVQETPPRLLPEAYLQTTLPHTGKLKNDKHATYKHRIFYFLIALLLLTSIVIKFFNT